MISHVRGHKTCTHFPSDLNCSLQPLIFSYNMSLLFSQLLMVSYLCSCVSVNSHKSIFICVCGYMLCWLVLCQFDTTKVIREEGTSTKNMPPHGSAGTHFSLIIWEPETRISLIRGPWSTEFQDCEGYIETHLLLETPKT